MGSRLEANSTAVRKRIEKHTFDNEEGDEYGGSKFGGFPEYFRRKKIKLQNLDVELRSQSVDKPQIFRGIVAHVNGFTQPSLNDLHHLIVSHGGGFMQYLDGKTTVTHIIASNLTPKKVEEFRRYRIVKPAWIVDSVNAGHVLPWDSYRVVHEGTAQKILQFDDGRIVSRNNDRVSGYRDQTDASWYTSQLRTLDATQPPIPDLSDLPLFNQERSAGEIKLNEHKTSGAVTESFSFDDDIDDLLIAENKALEQQISATEALNEVTVDLVDETSDSRIEANQSDREDIPRDLKRRASSDTSIPESSPKRSKLTAEEHNSILLADPRIRKSSVLNPEFLEQYYRESRLHHLSAWKADLKSQLQALTAEKSASQQKRQKLAQGARRYILHVDFDSFFVAVSLKNHPQYIDLPACVAHGAGPNSEIASCNYPARKFGVKNGMWMKKAHELCKDLKVLPYDFPAYEAASRRFYDAILATGGTVQSVSIDEALVDMSELCLLAGGTDGVRVQEGSIQREQGRADETAQQLRDQIKDATGCSVSVGIGGNILLAKAALRKAKPAGQYQVMPEDVLEFIGNLQVQDLPGVANSIGGKLEEIGIKYVKDIREVPKERLVTILGPKTGEKIYNYARGVDRTEVGDQVVRKSVSAEVNWGVRFETQEQAEEFIESLCGELSRRLLKERVKGRQLTMKMMRRAADAPLDPPKHLGHGKCDTFNKSVVLGVATNAAQVLTKEALSILRSFGFSPGELRGLGIQMTRLEPIKMSNDGDAASSQRRLQFKAAGATIPAAALGAQQDPELSVPTFNSKDIPSSQRHLRFQTTPATTKLQAKSPKDPIQDDPETPKKAQTTWISPVQPPGIGPNADSPNRRPLNIHGTQFILPTQVDAAVLAELPEDIRSKLARHSKQTAEPSKAQPLQHKNGALAPKQTIASTALPAESQLDLEALQALPEDVREEILAHYATSPSGKSRGARQMLLPQSPRKTRTIPAPRRGTGTRGRPRGGSLLSRLRGGGAGRSMNGSSTLTQSNFVTTTRAASHDHTATDSEGGGGGGGGGSEGEISADFLAALPEDIRKEVLAQKKAEQLRRHGGLQVSARRRGGQGGRPQTVAQARQQQQQAPRGERIVALGAWPQKPSFTTRKLTAADDLRNAVEEWVDVFKDEGPYKEDIEALGRYLSDVVGVEKNMGKAVGIVEWMGWVVGGLESGESTKTIETFQDQEHEDETQLTSSESRTDDVDGKESWIRALQSIQGHVTEAVKARGLGQVHFDAFA